MQFGKAVLGIYSLACMLFLSVPLGATEEPAWLRYERARAAFEQGELGDALQHYRAALELEGSFPEAEAGIGMVLAAEGAFGPALRHLQGALQQAHMLQIPDEHYKIRYQIAEIHRLQANERDFERSLNGIIAGDQSFTSEQRAVERNARRRIYHTNGLDRMIELYRLEYHQAFNAHRLMAELHLREELYERALEHLIAANLQAFTVMIGDLRALHPVFEFTTVAELLREIRSESSLRNLPEQLHVYELMYLLAAASYGHDATSTNARTIWTLLAEDPNAGIWSRRAQMQLRNPQANALIGY